MRKLKLAAATFPFQSSVRFARADAALLERAKSSVRFAHADAALQRFSVQRGGVALLCDSGCVRRLLMAEEDCVDVSARVAPLHTRAVTRPCGPLDAAVSSDEAHAVA